jgi:hypothetical protein
MGAIRDLLGDAAIPDFYHVKYNFCDFEIPDAAAATRDALIRAGTADRIKEGWSVAITGSSREIKNADIILKTLITELKNRGAKPFIIPAMGSHGGATAEGQLAILEHYGISEETMGVPVISCMDTVEVGRTKEGLAVHVDRTAYGADCIIPVGRIKPHPEFRGDFESGIMKMLAIGLGKQHGAEVCHKLGMSRMSGNILDFGRVILEKCIIPFAIGIIENAFHGTYSIAAIPAECIEAEEKKLLVTAREITPVIPFEKVDVLICERMGKDISGTGMDSNVIGRSISLGVSKPFIERIGILALTEKTGGNFNGVALGDCITRRLFESLDFEATYPNSITASEPLAVKIPVVMDTDALCIRMCMRTCIYGSADGLRIVWIRDTLSLKEFFISPALLDEAGRNPQLDVGEDVFHPEFDGDENFIGFVRRNEHVG